MPVYNEKLSETACHADRNCLPDSQMPVPCVSQRESVLLMIEILTLHTRSPRIFDSLVYSGCCRIYILNRRILRCRIGFGFLSEGFVPIVLIEELHNRRFLDLRLLEGTVHRVTCMRRCQTRYELTGRFLCPEGPSTKYLRTLVPRTIPLMAFGTRVLKYWVLGPSGMAIWKHVTLLSGPGWQRGFRAEPSKAPANSWGHFSFEFTVRIAWQPCSNRHSYLMYCSCE